MVVYFVLFLNHILLVSSTHSLYNDNIAWKLQNRYRTVIVLLRVNIYLFNNTYESGGYR